MSTNYRRFWWQAAMLCCALGIGPGVTQTLAQAAARAPVSASHSPLAAQYVQSAEFTSSDGENDDQFGDTVAISGDTIVVGVPDHQVGDNFRQGAVYVFSETGRGWSHLTQVAELHASDGAAGDNFGTSVAIDGNTIVVGEPSHQVGANSDQGAAYVFAKPSHGWSNATQTAELTASNGAADDEFGMSVAISGRTIVAGADEATIGSNQYEGAAYVFSEPASGWHTTTQTAELTSSDGASFDAFGWSIATSGRTVVVGAPNHTVNGNSYQGAVYVYSEPSHGWTNSTQDAELASSDGVEFGGFGHALAIDGDTIAVGAYAQPNSVGSVQGAVYAFSKPADGWSNTTQTAELTASDGVADQYLGNSVAISGNTIVAGANAQKIGANSEQGAIYVFSKGSSGWTDSTQSAKLTAADGADSDSLGTAVAISGLTVVGGAYDHKVGGNFEQGAGYVFTTPAAVSLTAVLTGQHHTSRSITVHTDAVVHGRAALAGVDSATATGSVSYSVYADRRCLHQISGGRKLSISTPGILPSSPAVRLTHVGRYYWRVFYSGDESNAPAASACGSLVETVRRVAVRHR